MTKRNVGLPSISQKKEDRDWFFHCGGARSVGYGKEKKGNNRTHRFRDCTKKKGEGNQVGVKDLGGGKKNAYLVRQKSFPRTEGRC